jgi:iron complex outermembrane recepter protein
MSEHSIDTARHPLSLAAAIATVLLTAASPALAQSEAPEKVLPKVKVSDTATEDAYGPAPGYLAKRSGSGTKTDTPIIETPQSISVVTADQIRATNSQTLQETLVYTSGIATGSAAANPQIADTFFLRGFQADNQFGSFYRDGMRYQANISNGKQEPYGLERVEYLKGPASILYGTAAPGGIINTVSKRPQAFDFRELNLEFGSFERRQVSGDATGPIDEAGTWLYRVTALGREADTFVDFGRDDRVYVAPALTWRPTENLDVTLLTNYQKTKQSDPGQLPLNGTILPNANGELPRDVYLGEPDFNKFDTEIYSAGYELDYRISESLTLRNKLRYYDAKLDNEFVLLNNNGLLIGAQQRTLGRQARRHDDETTQLTSDTGLQVNVTTGPFEHTVLVGIDALRSKYQSVRLSGTYGNIDAFNPVPTGTRTLAPMRIQTDNRRQTGIYLQDQIKYDDKVVFTIGGRRDFFQNEDVIRAPTLAGSSNIRDRENATTGRAGLVYLFKNGLAPYASYSESFNPTNGQVDANLQPFEPDEGEQVEAGIRYQPPNGNYLLSAAVYEITRSNVLTPDPTGSGNSIQAGEVESRGVEVEAKGSFGQSLDLVLSYTYADTEITEGTCCVLPRALATLLGIAVPPGAPGVFVSNLGTSFSGVPRNSAALLADYRFDQLGVPDLSFGIGVRYSGRKPGNTITDSNLEVPSFTITDARLNYTFKSWRFAANVFNLTDKKFIPSNCIIGVRGCAFGEPRKFTASVSYNW